MAQKTGSDIMWFYYDSDGTRAAVEYKGKAYYYYYNLQGDVVGLFDTSLNKVVEYTYDSWGKLLSTTGSMASTLGKDNPFRYRSYYYDEESGLYYLNSRYYDPVTGRFVNADEVLIGNLLGNNLFAYCGNNPVNRYDPSGHFWEEIGDFFKGFFNDYNDINNLPNSLTTGNPLPIGVQGPSAPFPMDFQGPPVSIYYSKKATNRPDSGLIGVPDDEISRRARDKSLSGEERNRYKQEEKVRGLRNKQKRENYKKAFSDDPFGLPEIKNGLPDLNGNYKSDSPVYGVPGVPAFPAVPVFP